MPVIRVGSRSARPTWPIPYTALGFATLSMPSYDRALCALRTWLDSWSGRAAKRRTVVSPLVFCTPEGRSLGTSFKRYWQPAVKAARLADFRFHDLRHTFASRLVARGVSSYIVTQAGGWKTASMMQRYALRPLAGDARVFRYFARRKFLDVDASECDRIARGCECLVTVSVT